MSRKIIIRNNTHLVPGVESALKAANQTPTLESLAALKSLRYAVYDKWIKLFKKGIKSQQLNLLKTSQYSDMLNFLKTIPLDALEFFHDTIRKKMTIMDWVSFPHKFTHIDGVALHTAYTLRDYINRFNNNRDMLMIGGSICGQSYTRLLRSALLIGIIFQDLDTGIRSQPMLCEAANAYDMPDGVAFTDKIMPDKHMRRATAYAARVITFSI